MIVLTTFRNRTLTADPRSLVFREASILGSLSFSRYELAMAAELVASGRIRPIIGTEARPDDVLRLHGLLRSGELTGRGALRWI
jgi:D-arabinose 1-dehydrogenase-like Zn-dependent alcohol dehydrogenase